MVSQDQFNRLVIACRALAPAQNDYRVDDFVDNLLLTVLDFQMRTVAVERAMAHFKRSCREHLRSVEQIENLLARYADDQAGNTALATHLWGYKLWTRARMLRNLVRYFDTRGVRTQTALHDWARSSDYAHDFAGQVRGLGPAVYNWLVMRQGVETIKPDVHVMRFVTTVLGYPLSSDDAVDALKVVAVELGLKAYELDWRIWENQRRLASA